MRFPGLVRPLLRWTVAAAAVLGAPASRSGEDRPGRELSRERLAWLLAALHEDPDEAAREYERIRRRLLRLFTWRGARFPEELADRTLDHAAAALHASGETIRAADRFRYCCAVAFTTHREAIRAERRREIAEATHRELVAGARPAVAAADRAGALRTALSELDEPRRRLILEYYRDTGRQRIRRRRRLARALGISPGALRLRAHKLRTKLEKRLLQLLAEAPEGGST